MPFHTAKRLFARVAYRVISFLAFASFIFPCGCGGSGGGGDNHPNRTVAVSGTMRDAQMTPVVRGGDIEIVISTHPFPCGPGDSRTYFVHATPDALGHYTAAATIEEAWSNCGPWDISVNPRISCEPDRSAECYVPTDFNIRVQQPDFGTRSGVDIIVDRRFRIFGSVKFPNGLASTDPDQQPRAHVTPDVVGGNETYGGVANGIFFFGVQKPGTYTIDFDNTQATCASTALSGCNAAYDWSPTSVAATIVASDVDSPTFTATKK